MLTGPRSARTIAGHIDRGLEAVRRRAAGGAARDTDALAGLAELRREVEQLRHQQRTFELLLDSSGRGMARMPGPAHLAKLAAQIGAITGDQDAARRDVGVAFRLLVSLESLGVGRIAGGTMNICGKLATISSLEAPNDDVLEIGTLYGLFAAGLLRMLERAGRDPRLTVVDPLIGTQSQPGATMRADSSGTPVREAAVRTNLGLAGAAGGRARIHQGYSGDPAARAAVADREYGVIVVDGDHSQEGVAADLEWAEQIVAPGGVVVLDDYGDPRWTGVQAALDEHLAAGGSRLTLLGQVATSGFLRAR